MSMIIDSQFLINFIYELNEIYGYTDSITQQYYKKFIEYYKKGLRREYVKYDITEQESLDKSIELYYRLINILDIDFKINEGLHVNSNNNYTKNIHNITNEDIRRWNVRNDLNKYNGNNENTNIQILNNRFRLFFRIKNLNVDNEMISLDFLKKLKYFTRLLASETKYKLDTSLKLQLGIKMKLKKKDIEQIILDYQILWKNILIHANREKSNNIEINRNNYILYFPISFIQSVTKYYIDNINKINVTPKMKDFLIDKPKINLRSQEPKPIL